MTPISLKIQRRKPLEQRCRETYLCCQGRNGMLKDTKAKQQIIKENFSHIEIKNKICIIEYITSITKECEADGEKIFIMHMTNKRLVQRSFKFL